MDAKFDDVARKCDLVLKGLYINSLSKEINNTQRHLKNFNKRMKAEIEKSKAALRYCESELIVPDDVKIILQTLRCDLDASNTVREKHDILTRMETELHRIPNLPFLKSDGGGEEFFNVLKLDHCPVRVVYTDDGDMEYESDFESDTDDVINSERSGNCAAVDDERLPSPDQVGGRRKVPSRTGASNVPEMEISSARPKSGSISSVKQQSYATELTKDTLLPSGGLEKEEQTNSGKQQKYRRKNSYRAAALKELTGKSEYTLNSKEENIFSFSQLQHHLVNVETEEPKVKSKPEYAECKVIDTGYLQVPACTDVKMFDTYIVTAAGDSLVKVDKETKKVLATLKLQSVGHMCAIRKSSCIGVIQTNSFITVVSTEEDLKVRYKIKTAKAYTNICHIDTYVNTPRDIPDPSFFFGLVYTSSSNETGKRFVEKIDILRAAATQVQQRKPHYDARIDEFDVTNFNVSGISGIGAVWSNGNLKLILGCARSIVCLQKSKFGIEKNWDIAINKAATDVVCNKTVAYIAIQDEGRIMLVGVDGKVESENILGHLEFRPNKISVFGNTILVKAFEETRWKSLIFVETKY